MGSLDSSQRGKEEVGTLRLRTLLILPGPTGALESLSWTQNSERNHKRKPLWNCQSQHRLPRTVPGERGALVPTPGIKRAFAQ